MNDTTVSLSPHATFWLILSVVGLLALLLFSQILLPFAAGIVIAYLFHPLVNWMRRFGVHRAVSAFAIIALGTLAIVLLLTLIVPPILNQLSDLAQKLPGYVDAARDYIHSHYQEYLKPIQRFTQTQQPGNSSQPDVTQQVAQTVTPWLAAQLQNLLASSLALFDTIALLFLTPVVTFFLLRDWDKMVASVNQAVPRKDAPAIRQIANEINSTISAYLRGTLIVLAIISAFYMVALGFIGLNYGLLIGLGAGLISFIPYLGSSTGFLVSGAVAFGQFWPDYTKVALVLGVFVFGQVIEGNVLTPNIVGNKVRLHPVWLLFALVASGYLLGFTGLLISVPLAAAIGVLVRHLMRNYYESDMYEETDDTHGEKAAALSNH